MFSNLALGGLAALLAAALFLWWRMNRVSTDIVSLVFLLRAPRALSENVLRERLGPALGVTFPPGPDMDGPCMLVQIPPPESANMPLGRVTCFMMRVGELGFGINNFAMPYVDDKEGATAGVADARLRRAMLDHEAWLSVDYMEPRDATRPGWKEEAYRVIGKVMAALAGPDCLAIYCPELQRCNEYDDCLLDTLRGESPLTLFDGPTFAPVLSVSGDDPRMEAAMAEARERWPEFADAFRARENDDAPFLVKARFTEGNETEYMWVSVTAIDEPWLEGALENSPNALPHLNEGDAVRIAVEDMCDWLYARNGEPVGAFTQRVIDDNLSG